MILKRAPMIGDPQWDALTGPNYAERYAWVETIDIAPPLLDVGSGQGYQTTLLSKRIGRVTAIDIDPNLVACTLETAELNHADIIAYQGDAHALPFNDNSYRTVCCFEMLEHLEDPQTVVHECVRVLVRGGKFVASCPRHGMMGPDKFDEHVQDFLAEDLIRMTEHAGLRLTEYHTTDLFQMLVAVKP